jgi:hypothetical protein
MDESNVTLLKTDTARPLNIPQIGLESIGGSIVADNVQTSPVANPIGKIHMDGYDVNQDLATFASRLDSTFQLLLAARLNCWHGRNQ